MGNLQSFDPATGEVVGEVETTEVERIPTLVARARDAGEAWAALSFEARAEVLRQAGARLRDRVEALGRLACREMGKPLAEATGEARHTAERFEDDLRDLAVALAPEVQDSERIRTTLYRDAFGVAACISPWNFPILMPHEQILPALAAGNAVIFKPSEETPLTGQAYADAFLEVLPEGVLQVVHGDEDQGKALVAADVDLVVFTGSRAAGKHILAEASRSLKRVILELGGKDPLVVLEGADAARAARFAARNTFRNAGQVCVATERMYVHDSLHDAFVAALQAEAEAMPVGNGLEPSTAIGPMVNARQREHVRRAVAHAREQGARLHWAGEAPEGAVGSYQPPVILTGCTHEMRIAHDETFGPVACVYRVSDEDEAVRLANDSRYGLGAVVYGPHEAARRVARRLKVGMVGVNQGLSTAGAAPWVGARESGYGFHSGRDGHRQFAQVRVLNERLG